MSSGFGLHTVLLSSCQYACEYDVNERDDPLSPVHLLGVARIDGSTIPVEDGASLTKYRG